MRLGSFVVVAASMMGCASATTLSVASRVPLRDQSVPTPQKPAYAIVMVLPPKGSERGEVSELAPLEKALLKQGVRVISSGVTGRVVIDNAQGQKNEGAAQLTDLERALILARKSGAEALLQVAAMEWTEDPKDYRYFLLQPDGETVAEVSKADFEAAPPARQWKITGRTLHFEAKVIDVESGEIVAAVDLAQSTDHEVASKTIPLTVKGGAILDPGAHETSIDTPELREGAVAEMMAKLASIIAQGKQHEARPSAKEVALDDARKKCVDDLSKSEAERQRLAEDIKRRDDERKRADEEAIAKQMAEVEAARKVAKKR